MKLDEKRIRVHLSKVKVLFVNACVRKGSRTKELADFVLSKQKVPYEEVCLNALNFPVVDEAFLNRRDRLIDQRGLCRAKRLTYITTVGGDFFPEEYGAGYVKALAQNYYGIPGFRLIKAAGLDIIGADSNAIMDHVRQDITKSFLESEQ